MSRRKRMVKKTIDNMPKLGRPIPGEDLKSLEWYEEQSGIAWSKDRRGKVFEAPRGWKCDICGERFLVGLGFFSHHYKCGICQTQYIMDAGKKPVNAHDPDWRAAYKKLWRKRGGSIWDISHKDLLATGLVKGSRERPR